MHIFEVSIQPHGSLIEAKRNFRLDYLIYLNGVIQTRAGTLPFMQSNDLSNMSQSSNDSLSSSTKSKRGKEEDWNFVRLLRG